MLGAIVRFIVSALVLWVVSWITPGVQTAGFMGAFWAALAIVAIGWLVERALGRNISPQARGFTGFLTAAAVIWLTGYLFPGLISVTFIGALIASFIIGVVDAIVPTALR